MTYKEILQLSKIPLGFFSFSNNEFNQYEGIVGEKYKLLSEDIKGKKILELTFEFFSSHFVSIPLHLEYDSFQSHNCYFAVYFEKELYVFDMRYIFNEQGLVNPNIRHYLKIRCDSYLLSSKGIYIFSDNSLFLYSYEGNEELLITFSNQYNIISSSDSFVFLQDHNSVICYSKIWGSPKRIKREVFYNLKECKVLPYFFIYGTNNIFSSDEVTIYSLSETGISKIGAISVESQTEISWIGPNLFIKGKLYSIDDLSRSIPFFTRYIDFANDDGTRVVVNKKIYEDTDLIPNRRIITSFQGFTDERLFRISYPYRFDFILDTEGRKYFLFSDSHFSNKNICYGISLYDNISALTEQRPDILFDYFLEANLTKNEDEHLPINNMINRAINCLGKDQPRPGCWENVWHHWLEIRDDNYSDLLAKIFNENYSDFHRAFSEGKCLSYFISEFEKITSGMSELSRLFFTSIHEFELLHPEKYRNALRVCEINLALDFISLLDHLSERVKEVFLKKKDFYEVARLLHPYIMLNNLSLVDLFVGTILFDLNFISRVEHHYKTHDPSVIIYYAGGMHINNFIEYLRLIGIERIESYGELLGKNADKNRCIYLDKPLTDFLNE